ncbi:antibiotic biosynthesis monooxygenase [Streptomyces sp. CB01881]|uniref:antibiotic biosynthesis monooxygenase n=1 Tax=Streptomyces sp. CB01881 TaxID=2078691 RepID=UPI000CDCD4B1|nr:antibiotic biosynthesis monooxygenase [Streptomyces sp. CB01881]AUY48830.1 antibiotic biosynthesis monooxygenase [Streptomyces sp. CB01881]TYC77318.1 antibiotic biosynthesis monooxygenase [Streptomyces sp. CB01881]
MATTTRDTMAGSGQDEEVTLFVARRVEPGYEEAFEVWAKDILAAAAAHEGNLGTGLLRPAGPDDPWHLLLHFRDGEAFRSWQASPARAACFAVADGHHHEVHRHEILGMEGWFATTKAAASKGRPPVRWKMAVASTLAIAPIVVTSALLIAPHLSGLPTAVRPLVTAPLISALMTYAALPVVTRLLRPWLFRR